MEQVIKLLFYVQIIDKNLFTTVSCVIDKKSDNRFGDWVVDILFDYIKVGGDESFDHFRFCLLSQFRVFGHFDNCGYAGEFVAW